METILDPGHELNDAAWTFLTGAQRKAVPDAFAGDYVSEVTLSRGAGDVDGVMGQHITLLDLGARSFRYAARKTVDAGSNFDIHVELYEGHIPIVASPAGSPFHHDTALISAQTVGDGWVEYAGLFAAPPSNEITLIVRVEYAGVFDIGTSRWEFDSWRYPDTETNPVKWEALSGLITRLKAINGGATYNNDLSSRVYTRELFPDDNPDVTMPFITMIEKPAAYPNWQRAVEAEFGVYVRAFVKDTSSDLRDTATTQALAEIHDDIWNTLMTDQTLGGTVHDLTVNSSDAPPQGKGREWAGIEFDITMTIHFSQSELTP